MKIPDVIAMLDVNWGKNFKVGQIDCFLFVDLCIQLLVDHIFASDGGLC